MKQAISVVIVEDEELAAKHREFEQRVNYFKAMVKNLVTTRNAQIAKHNADIQNAAAKTNNARFRIAFSCRLR